MTKHLSNILMSAPAMKHPGFPDMRTAALTSLLPWISLKRVCISLMTSSFKELTWKSKVVLEDKTLFMVN
jgi:hypothetical protein